MFTQNYYNLIANMAGASGGANSANGKPGLILINTSGVPRNDVLRISGFPNLVSATPVLNNSTSGIIVGTDGTPPTLQDINLGNMITSGVSMSLASSTYGCDTPGAPYVLHKIAITNTGDRELIIREVGYQQSVYYGQAVTTCALFDRTVLDTPITIQGGDSAVIDYKLQTLPVERTKHGVNLVSFVYGSDEDVAAMIDAAQNGTIDLREDGLWRVGDFRKIHLDAWTGGGDTAHAAQDVYIVISQFGDYNSCGSVLQFDFLNPVAEKQRMNSSNVNNYGTSEMYTTTLPALVEALPSWLKNRLKTFSVLVSEGGGSSAIETVGNNKLALRSEVEMGNSHNNTAEGEGSIVALYKYGGNKVKYLNSNGAADAWWFRSPYTRGSGTTYYTASNSSNGATISYQPTYTNLTIAPFGCL